MASIQARHQRGCEIGRPWTTFADALDGCTCKSGPLYHTVTRVNGKLVRESIGHNRKHAARQLTSVQARIDADEYEPPSTMTFGEWADEWLVGVRRRGTTKANYAVTLAYAKAVFGSTRLRKLTTADVQAMLEHVEEANTKRKRTTSPATLAKHLRQLSVCLEAARRRSLIAVNPVGRMDASSKPRPDKRSPSYFTDSELIRLWPELVARVAYLHAAKLALTTGMRFGELAGLYVADMQLLDGVVALSRQWTAGEEVPTTKGGRPRTIDLVPAAQQLLEAWLQIRGPEDGLLFEREQGGHLDNDEARDVLYAAMGRAGIPRIGEGGGKRDWHSFRHTFARTTLESGAAIAWVSEQLGHSTIVLTVNTYGHWSHRRERRSERPPIRNVGRRARSCPPMPDSGTPT